MKITAAEFIDAKFGNQVKLSRYLIEPKRPGDDIQEGDLVDILTEFKNLLLADNIGESLNPRIHQYTVVDKDRAIIIGHFDKRLL
jgi:hypothetical protein